MINLLPPSLKADIASARKNVKLVKLNMILTLIIIGMAIITLSGIFYMDQSKKAYNDQIARSKEVIESQNLNKLQKEVNDISGNIKLTTSVLSKEILFSKLIRQIGAIMPENTSLSGLNIGAADGGVALTAVATDYNNASQIQVNLVDPNNKLFDKADIVNISCVSAAKTQYPCDVTISARFSDINSFLFINPKEKK